MGLVWATANTCVDDVNVFVLETRVVRHQTAVQLASDVSNQQANHGARQPMRVCVCVCCVCVQVAEVWRDGAGLIAWLRLRARAGQHAFPHSRHASFSLASCWRGPGIHTVVRASAWARLGSREHCFYIHFSSMPWRGSCISLGAHVLMARTQRTAMRDVWASVWCGATGLNACEVVADATLRRLAQPSPA